MMILTSLPVVRKCALTRHRPSLHGTFTEVSCLSHKSRVNVPSTESAGYIEQSSPDHRFLFYSIYFVFNFVRLQKQSCSPVDLPEAASDLRLLSGQRESPSR